MKKRDYQCVFLSLLLSVLPFVNFAAADSLLIDENGDGLLFYLAFGDSITYGSGDGTQPGQDVPVAPRTDGTGGYPARLEAWLGIAVRNAARPGEYLTTSGQYRFVSVVQGSAADIVGVMEGVNDTFKRPAASDYELAYQRVVNVTQALGKKPLLITLPQPCCFRKDLAPFARLASGQVRAVSARNGLPYVDVEKAWSTTCANKGECELLCRPDGLHPNSKGYDVIAQTVAAVLMGIDIFASDGAKQLEDALGWEPGTVIVKPASTAG
ncbi:MAG: SGNH/GDSL hydrolase family protein [Deltaproteobacteria bacterium]|nr:SGNH/GDSL hydrolase family protein [Deltaproteobacteria bacterium]